MQNHLSLLLTPFFCETPALAEGVEGPSKGHPSSPSFLRHLQSNEPDGHSWAFTVGPRKRRQIWTQVPKGTELTIGSSHVDQGLSSEQSRIGDVVVHGTFLSCVLLPKPPPKLALCCSVRLSNHYGHPSLLPKTKLSPAQSSCGWAPAGLALQLTMAFLLLTVFSLPRPTQGFRAGSQGLERS